MEQERPYTETEPETAAETVETVPETAETLAETGEPAPKQPRVAHPHVADRGVRTADRGGDGHGRRAQPGLLDRHRLARVLVRGPAV